MLEQIRQKLIDTYQFDDSFALCKLDTIMKVIESCIPKTREYKIKQLGTEDFAEWLYVMMDENRHITTERELAISKIYEWLNE